MRTKKFLLAAALLATGAFGLSANAATPSTSTFQVLMKINRSCSIAAGSASDIRIGDASGVDAGSAVGSTGSNSLSVTCSNQTPYNIALQSSNNTSTSGEGTLKAKTAGNTDTLTYQLSSVSAAGPAWGNQGVSATAAGNGVSGVGSGLAQSYPVFAKVTSASPTSPTPDDYSDTVTVSVYF